MTPNENINSDELETIVPVQSTQASDTPTQEAEGICTNAIEMDTAIEEENSPTFEDIGISPELSDGVKKLAWDRPTPIQALCLPHSLAGKDVAGFAQTGTGKTGAFLLTLGHMWLKAAAASTDGIARKNGQPFAVVLSPTRELAMQIEDECQKLLGDLGIKSVAVFGGTNWEGQAKQLKQEIDIIIATPGRLRDYHNKKLISLNGVNTFICDEADRMFDMGFIEDVEFFLSKIEDNAQKLVFSATTNDRVKELVFKYLNNPEYISVSPEEITPDRIEQHLILCETQHKFKLLLWMLQEHSPDRAMIFTNTKMAALWLHYKLAGNGIEVDLITGDLPQAKRIRLIKQIKEGNINILIATDVASRGLHISGVTHVYNFDIPDEAANYVHRIGRTARAGEKGASFSLLCEEYASNFSAVKRILGKSCPAATWPNSDEFMSMEDKSGNPFEDENCSLSKDTRDRNKKPERFDRDKKKPVDSGIEDRKRRSQERDKEREKIAAKDKVTRSNSKKGRSNRFDKSKGKDRLKGADSGRNTAYKSKNQNDSGKRDHSKRNKHSIGVASKKSLLRDKKSGSIFGMVKRFFSLLFKSKS